MKSGLVAIVGKPNAGKSTLLNALLERKISIVSARPATTRLKILGILTDPERGQIVFVDTPGFEEARNQLGKFMLSTIMAAVAETDLILFLIGANGWKEADERILSTLRNSGKKILLVINKVDLAPRKEGILPLMEESSRKYGFAEIVPISALKDKKFDRFIGTIFAHLPEGEPSFSEDEITNVPNEYYIAEVIREKILRQTYEEVPQEIAVEVTEIADAKKGADMVVIAADVILGRENLKSIIIGKGGQKLKTVGQAARKDIEEFLGRRVYLELKVKVIDNWRDRPDIFHRFGYGT